MPWVYTVKLIVANSRPCVDSIVKQIQVSEKPSLALPIRKYASRAESVFLKFFYKCYILFMVFRNGVTSTVGGLTYTYPNAGTYNVTLTAINGDCRDSSTQSSSSEIYPKPFADFIYDFTDNGFNAPIIFTNSTVNGQSYIWTFGDGDSTTTKKKRIIQWRRTSLPSYLVYCK